MIHPKEKTDLVRSTMLAVILCCLLVTPTFLVTEAVALRRSIKKGMPKNSAKPTGKRHSQSLPFNKEETPAHALSREIRETLKNTAPLPPFTEHHQGMLP